jgi:hypothetical protein
MVVVEAVISTSGVFSPLLVRVISLLVTVVVVLPLVTVSTQRTTRPAWAVGRVKAGLLVPVLLPITCHWKLGAVPPFCAVAVNT